MLNHPHALADLELLLALFLHDGHHVAVFQPHGDFESVRLGECTLGSLAGDPAADCAGYDQVVLEADRIDDLMRAAWARRQLKARTLLKTSSLEAVRSLVGAGAGIAVLPDFLYRPWTLDAEHVQVRTLRDSVASSTAENRKALASIDSFRRETNLQLQVIREQLATP